MTLWAILTIMTSAAAVFLAAPFLRRLDRQPEAPAARDIEVYRDQLAEVEKEAATGLIDSDQAETASTEIKRRLLAADRAAAPRLAGFSLGERNFAAVAMTGIIVLGSVALYALNGSPDLPSASVKTSAAGQGEASAVDRLAAATLPPSVGGLPQSPPQARLGTVDEMISKLIDRLNRSPNDPEGWRMLGWSYFGTERFAQAATAYAKAIELNPTNAELRSARGEALVRAADGLVTDEAKAVFGDALRRDAKDPRARFFIGLAKEQAGNKLAALDDWVAILTETDANEAWVGDLRQRVAELGQETGVDVSARLRNAPPATASGGLLGMLQRPEQSAPIAAPNAVPNAPNAVPNKGGPSADDIRNAEAMKPVDRMAMIQSMVDRLASRLDQSPRDVEGWIRLMRSRQVLGEADAAEQTFRFALDVFRDAPQEQERIAAAARELGLAK
ncbi:MAG TPA: c-type cytochrome biogenesis protein CcmI [Xanthobacteraceae bacterium]